MSRKVRLDELVLARGVAADLREARALIVAGEIWISGRRADKAGSTFQEGEPLEHRPRASPFVSRGGEKLDGALDALGIEVAGRVCLDLGASTGGFTDCLLQRGAPRVFAVDVGRGQLDWRLQNDSRVDSLEGVNVRYLKPEDIEEPPELITADLSFISLRPILPVIRRFAPAPALLLVKPQFEAERSEVEPGGLIRDPERRRQILERLAQAAAAAGFQVLGQVDSSLAGRKGNLEAFLWLENPVGSRS